MAMNRGLRVTLGGTAELLLQGDRYDAIVVQSVLEHVTNPASFIGDLARLLVPGGVLVLSAPTPGPFFWDDPTHIRPHTPKSFKLLAEISGLECEYLSYVFAFLLGVEIRAPIFFQALNVLPISLGSNLVAFFRKPTALVD